MMKEIYTKPVVEEVEFDTLDTVTTSIPQYDDAD